MTAQWRKWGTSSIHFGLLAAFMAFTALPFYWMLITTFKDARDLLNPDNNLFLFNASHPATSAGVVHGDAVRQVGACVLASVPIAVLYNFFLDRFISGFTVVDIK